MSTDKYGEEKENGDIQVTRNMSKKYIENTLVITAQSMTSCQFVRGSTDSGWES